MPKRRSSRWRESLYSPTPIGRCAPDGGCHIAGYYVSYVQLMQARGPSVHKKNPGRGRMGEPKPTRASMVMVAPLEPPRNAQQCKAKAAPNGMV